MLKLGRLKLFVSQNLRFKMKFRLNSYDNFAENVAKHCIFKTEI